MALSLDPLRRARRLRRPWRYLAGAARPRRRVSHRLRNGGGTVVLRHGTPDVAVFHEVFCAGVYEPPAPAAAALARAPAPLHVVDLGANVGLFGAFAAWRWPGARITAFEPDPDSLVSLRACARAHVDVAWRVMPCAAATRAARIRFTAGRHAESHEANADEKSIEVDAVDVFDHLADVDLLKIDIEGGEWAILGDPRMATVPARAIVLEHHGRRCPTTTPRETATELLRAAGYEVQPVGDAPAGVGLLWAWR